MGLVLSCATLLDWRCAQSLELEFSPAMTVLAGPNAYGKTNTVEALQLLTAGVSFRHPSPRDLVRQGAEVAKASARLEGDGRLLDVAVIASESSRRFTRNGKAVRPSEIPGTLLSVLFNPDDLGLVKGSASARRDEVDAFGSQASRAFAQVVKTYKRSIEQRNRLLKEPQVDMSLLDAWDASVAVGAGTLLYHRTSLLARLGELVSEAHEAVAPERLIIRYESSLGPLEAGSSRQDLIEQMAEALKESRAEDLRRGFTTKGPQRDDIGFELDGRPLRTFGSQGQQRTAVLAWKMAQVRFAQEVLGQTPLLLLDDVMSELDAHRRKAVSGLVGQGVQAVVTTTHLGYFDPQMLADASVIEFTGKGVAHGVERWHQRRSGSSCDL